LYKRGKEKKTMGSKLSQLALAWIILIIFFYLLLNVAAEPFGASTVTPGRNERAPNDTPQSHGAQAGNVTEIIISGYSITQSWQGYFGNVTGTLMLADASDNVMYNWSEQSPAGEIFASTNSTIMWNSVMCFNFTADGTGADDSGQVGNTSFYGTNKSQLETIFNINESDVDGIDETFTLIGAGTHDEFFVASHEFEDGECQSTRIFSDAGKGEDNKFEEILLYEYQTGSTIFTTLLEQDLTGFDSGSHDFQMIVPEDGHDADVETTEYFFFLEIQ
jgi:hypothetical protein